MLSIISFKYKLLTLHRIRLVSHLDKNVSVYVVDMENKSNLRAACLKETADLGVDLIIDLRSSPQV